MGVVVLKSLFKIWLLACVLLLPLSANVYAAGLGRITVISALGQPFKAEIDLVAIKKEEAAQITARIAPFETFRQANIDYAPFLATFKFSVETRANGEPYLKVISAQPVGEPFVSMLVELNWPAGRLLREYTVLLDPPETEAVKPVAPVVSAAPAPVSKAADSAARAVPETKSVAAPSAPAAAPGKNVAKAADTTYTVQRGDTLAGIARQFAPAEVDLNQMLVALYRANRDAFVNNNMNRLKIGPILRVPDSREVSAIASAEAGREVKAQASDWNAYRSKLAALSGGVPAAQSSAQAASGKITAKVEDKAVAAKEQPKEVLKLSKGETAGGTGAGKDSGKGAQSAPDRVRALEEESIAKGKALKEANERVAILEKNIKEMQRLLEIKNPGLAAAQKQAQAPAAAPPAPPPAATAPAAVVPPAATSVAAVSAVAATAPAAVAEAKPAKPKPAAPPPPEPEPDLFDMLMENIEIVGGALAALVIGLVGFFVMKRKKK